MAEETIERVQLATIGNGEQVPRVNLVACMAWLTTNLPPGPGISCDGFYALLAADLGSLMGFCSANVELDVETFVSRLREAAANGKAEGNQFKGDSQWNH